MRDKTRYIIVIVLQIIAYTFAGLGVYFFYSCFSKHIDAHFFLGMCGLMFGAWFGYMSLCVLHYKQ